MGDEGRRARERPREGEGGRTGRRTDAAHVARRRREPAGSPREGGREGRSLGAERDAGRGAEPSSERLGGARPERGDAGRGAAPSSDDGTRRAEAASEAGGRGAGHETGSARRAGGGAPYTDPYLAGVGIGLVLLVAFVVVGRGLGASGAFGAAATATVSGIAPDHAAGSTIYGGFVAAGDGHPLNNWLVFEILGVLSGGALSAVAAGRFRFVLDRGPRATTAARAYAALAGGTLMGFGAALARGCTSGQALSGGSLLSVGAWLFIAAAFAAGYAAAPACRRLWT